MLLCLLLLLTLPGSLPFRCSRPHRGPSFSLHSNADASSLLQEQVDLLMLATSSSLVALYLRNSVGAYELASQNPSSVVLPFSAEESTLSWLRFNGSTHRESFSLPIESRGHGFWGYLVVSLTKDHQVSEKEMQIFDKVISTIARILSLGEGVQDRVDIDQSNSHIITIRTFLKMISKRYPSPFALKYIP